MWAMRAAKMAGPSRAGLAIGNWTVLQNQHIRWAGKVFWRWVRWWESQVDQEVVVGLVLDEGCEGLEGVAGWRGGLAAGDGDVGVGGAVAEDGGRVGVVGFCGGCGLAVVRVVPGAVPRVVPRVVPGVVPVVVEAAVDMAVLAMAVLGQDEA